MAITSKKRIWGWMAFDWASQPFYTLGLTFIFGPYFAAVAAEYYLNTGMEPEAAKAQSQSIWSFGQSIAGIFIALTAPFLGSFADNSGRKIPWIAITSVVFVICTWSLWGLTPDGAHIFWALILFYIAFIAAEYALNFTNAILPSLGDARDVGRISGSGAAFGYWGGVAALFFILLLLAENEDGVTLLGRAPLFGLDADAREGTRAVGPLIAIWFMLFMIPFYLWVRDDPNAPRRSTKLSTVAGDLWATLRSLRSRRSLLNFLLSSMFYRDGLNALYGFGGFYAVLVLGWETVQVGIFGIVAAIAAAIITYLGGRADARFGPKPVIITAVWVLIVVSIVIVSMDRTQVLGIDLADGSALPDYILFFCGACIGGAGGAVYAASRSMMVRHTHPDRPAEAFGLFALSGKATAFLAPLLIGIFTLWTGSPRLGFAPVIALFIIGLFLLRYVDKDGDSSTP